jgi:translation initiation factor 2 subunit 1
MAKADDENVFQADDKPLLRCRFYENEFPEPEEVVIVNVTEIGEMGAYVTLLEYDNIEGMILLSELSRRRIRSINKLVRVNRTEVVMVIRVDKEKGYIDLSKRRVDPEDVAKCEERYNKAKAVHSVMRHVADQKNMGLEEMYKLVGWPLYRKYKHAYDAFKVSLTDSDEDIFTTAEIENNVDDNTKTMILNYVKRRLAPQPVKVRADIEVTCFTYEGIDAIREALLAGEAKGTEIAPVKIKLIAPPMYVMTSMTLDKDIGIETMNAAIEIIKASIQSNGGALDVKMAPKAVTLREETELQAMLDRLALEQEEVDGDAPEDA